MAKDTCLKEGEAKTSLELVLYPVVTRRPEIRRETLVRLTERCVGAPKGLSSSLKQGIIERGDARGSVKASGERGNEERDKKWLHRNMEFYRTASVPLSVQKQLSANSPITDNSKSQRKFWKKESRCWEAPPRPTPSIPDPAPRQQLLPHNCSRLPASFLRLSRPALHLECPEPLHLSYSLDPVLAAHLHLRILRAHPEMGRALLSGGPGCLKARV